MKPANDRIGERFGHLTVIDAAPRSKAGFVSWRCRCDCGNEVVIESYRLSVRLYCSHRCPFMIAKIRTTMRHSHLHPTFDYAGYFEMAGVNPQVGFRRLAEGMSLEDAAKPYSLRNRRYYDVGDGPSHLSELARQHGISRQTLHARLKRGWDIERALTTPVTTRRHKGSPDLTEE